MHLLLSRMRYGRASAATVTERAGDVVCSGISTDDSPALQALAEGAAASPKPGKPTVNISFRKQMSIGGAKTPKSQGGVTPKGSLEVPRPQTSTSAAILAAQAAINRAKATGAAAPPAEAVVAVEKGWHMYGPEHVKPRSEVGGPAQASCGVSKGGRGCCEVTKRML